ncbi:MAG: hypothetical protein LBB21_06855 [Holosporaceae bacterium]|nr:hypothetical protein [Holosporaceae bacterium]
MLKTASEADDVIKMLPLDSDLLYAKGIIARERGLSHLRLNKVKEVYEILCGRKFEKFIILCAVSIFIPK